MTSINKISKLLDKATDIEKKTFPKKSPEQKLRDYDYMNDPEFSEYQQIVDEAFIEAQKINAGDCVAKTIKLINKLTKKLNEEETHEFTERMKKWFNKVGV